MPFSYRAYDQEARPLVRIDSRPYVHEVEYWLQKCPNLDVRQRRTFGSPSPPLGFLTTGPEKVLALARATF